MSKATLRWDEPHTYVVEGRGDFPTDMLRRDCAWPATTDDANAMLRRDRRRVTLTAAMCRHINIARWESFGWRVVDGFTHGFPCPLGEYIDASA